MDNTKKALFGGRVLLENGVWEARTVLTEGGRIAALPPADQPLPDGFGRVDCTGAWVAPGLIDTHVHGALGHNFMEGTDEALSVISQFLVRGGVTSCLGTTTSASPAEEAQALRCIRGAAAHPVRGQVQLLGAHLEGPFINPTSRGAHAQRSIRPAAYEELEAIWAAAGESLKVVTLAPEVAGAMEAVRFFGARGVSVSIGHTQAGYSQTQAALDAGANRATHLFNAMPPLHHREPGAVAALLLDGRAYLELTVDGKHLAPETVALVLRCAGNGRCVLITDGVDVRGLGDGAFRRWEGTDVVVQNGEARTAAGSLAGSMLCLSEAVKNMVELVGVPLADAVRMASEYPARSVGLFHQKGSIAPGKDADFVLLRADLTVDRTIVRGDIVYKGEAFK